MHDAKAVKPGLGSDGEAYNQMKFAALVANDEKGVLHSPRAEGLRIIERLEECTHLGCRHLGDLDLRLRHCHPTSTALDAVDDEQRKTARRQILPIGMGGRARSQGACGDADPRGGPHRQYGVDPQGCEPHAAVFGHEAGRPVSRAQDGLVAFGGDPYRRRLVAARQHAGNGAAGREGLEMASQLVVRQHAREVHQRILVGEIPIPHAPQGIVRRMPARRRIDDQ